MRTPFLRKFRIVALSCFGIATIIFLILDVRSYLNWLDHDVRDSRAVVAFVAGLITFAVCCLYIWVDVSALRQLIVDDRRDPKTAQPGATDNPDDAQRLREDH